MCHLRQADCLVLFLLFPLWRHRDTLYTAGHSCTDVLYGAFSIDPPLLWLCTSRGNTQVFLKYLIPRIRLWTVPSCIYYKFLFKTSRYRGFESWESAKQSTVIIRISHPDKISLTLSRSLDMHARQLNVIQQSEHKRVPQNKYHSYQYCIGNYWHRVAGPLLQR